jgi:hypothetical protein
VGFIKFRRVAGLSAVLLIEYMGLVQQSRKTIEARKAMLIER